MQTRENVLLLFSKLPEPGLVKTRLTTLKDGIFSPEAASVLYHCMLFDVVETCMAAFDELEAAPANADVQDVYRLMISTAPAGNLPRMEELFESSGTWPRPIEFISDAGASFDEHYDDAFRKAWEADAECILSMGADMPVLTTDDVVRGFRALHELESTDAPGIVLAPHSAARLHQESESSRAGREIPAARAGCGHHGGSGAHRHRGGGPGLLRAARVGRVAPPHRSRPG